MKKSDQRGRRARGEGLLREGKSDVEVAGMLGVSVCSVWKWRNRLGLPSTNALRRQRGEALLRLGWRDGAVAADVGADPKTIGLWRRRLGLSPARQPAVPAPIAAPGPGPLRAGQRWRPQAERLLLDGLAAREVARRLGVEVREVRRWRRQLGIAPAHRGLRLPGLTPQKRQRAVDLVRAGKPDREVQKCTGVTARFLRALRQELGIETPDHVAAIRRLAQELRAARAADPDAPACAMDKPA